MEEGVKLYWENPNLILGLSIAVITLCISLGWLVRWVLNKLISVIEKNTKTHEAVLKYIETNDRRVAESVDNNTKAFGVLTSEFKLGHMELKQLIHNK